MRLACKEFNIDLEFEAVKLLFEDSGYSNIFSKKNNKTLQETLTHRRYSKFASLVEKSYPRYLSWPLGKFLLHLKNSNDLFYLEFLNKYGDSFYCQFSITDDRYSTKKGIYAFTIQDQVQYIGRCKNTFKNRINLGCGKIQPKNCFIDGQLTNCRLNSLIEKCKDKILFFVSVMKDNQEIESCERKIIRLCNPPWNIIKYRE